MRAAVGKQNVTVPRCQTTFARIVYKPRSLVPICEHPIDILGPSHSIHLIMFLHTVKIPNLVDQLKRESTHSYLFPVSEFNSHVTGLEDRMEKLEALLKQVKPLIAIVVNLSPPRLAIETQFDGYPATI